MTSRAGEPTREVRATFTADTVLVYQAFNSAVADAAVTHQRFVEPFGRARMTWVKPSYLWCCYRSGWARKENQERLLAVEITRAGFETALRAASLASYEPQLHGTEKAFKEQLGAAPNRVQWDPERDLRLDALPRVRSLQLGIGPQQVNLYADEWVVGVRDLTEPTHRLQQLVQQGAVAEAEDVLPPTSTYPLPDDISASLGADAAPVER